jgi:hypothetical protein
VNERTAYHDSGRLAAQLVHLNPKIYLGFGCPNGGEGASTLGKRKHADYGTGLAQGLRLFLLEIQIEHDCMWMLASP